MYIISQDKKHLLNTDHIISIDINQPDPDGTVKITASQATELPHNGYYILGSFKSEKSAETVLEFIAFCKANGEDKIAKIPTAEEVETDISEVLSHILRGSKDAEDRTGNPLADLFDALMKGGL